MAKTEVKLNIAGLRKMRQSQEMLDLTEKYAQNYSGKTKTFVGFDRAKTIVYGKGKKQ